MVSYPRDKGDRLTGEEEKGWHVLEIKRVTGTDT